MEITTEMVMFVLVFVLGVVVGVYIMTQVDNKREREMLSQMEDLQLNIEDYISAVKQLTRKYDDAIKLLDKCTCDNKRQKL